jgi:hypothetical protein
MKDIELFPREKKKIKNRDLTITKGNSRITVRNQVNVFIVKKTLIDDIWDR